MARIKPGSIDQTIDIFIQDSASTVGAGLTALVYNSAGLTCYYRRGATGALTALSLVTQTVGGAHSDGGFVLIDNTNAPGLYRLDLSDDIVAAGVPYVILYLRGATNMAPTIVRIELEEVQADLVKINNTTTNVSTLATSVAEIGTAGDGLTDIPWNAAWDAEVESEINDALNTAIAELGVGAPTATPTLRTGLMLLYMALRNKTVVQTSGTDALEIYDDSDTLITSKLITDDGSDYTEEQCQ